MHTHLNQHVLHVLNLSARKAVRPGVTVTQIGVTLQHGRMVDRMTLMLM